MTTENRILKELGDYLIKNIRAGKYETNTDWPIDRKPLAVLDLLLDLEIISADTLAKWKDRKSE